jgi:hypothetical protein
MSIIQTPMTGLSLDEGNFQEDNAAVLSASGHSNDLQKTPLKIQDHVSLLLVKCSV